MFKVKVNWDTDGQDVGLPNIVDVPTEIEDENVADWLSDKYGWCVNSWEITNDKEWLMKKIDTMVKEFGTPKPNCVKVEMRWKGDDADTIGTIVVDMSEYSESQTRVPFIDDGDVDFYCKDIDEFKKTILEDKEDFVIIDIINFYSLASLFDKTFKTVGECLEYLITENYLAPGDSIKMVSPNPYVDDVITEVHTYNVCNTILSKYWIKGE